MLSIKSMCLKVLANGEDVDAGLFSYLVFLCCFGHCQILMTEVLNRKKSPREQNKPFWLPFQDTK